MCPFKHKEKNDPVRLEGGFGQHSLSQRQAVLISHDFGISLICIFHFLFLGQMCGFPCCAQ